MSLQHSIAIYSIFPSPMTPKMQHRGGSGSGIMNEAKNSTPEQVIMRLSTNKKKNLLSQPKAIKNGYRIYLRSNGCFPRFLSIFVRFGMIYGKTGTYTTIETVSYSKNIAHVYILGLITKDNHVLLLNFGNYLMERSGNWEWSNMSEDMGKSGNSWGWSRDRKSCRRAPPLHRQQKRQ